MSTRAGLAIIALLIVLVVAMFAISGCASRPLSYCERWDAKVYARDGELLGMYLEGENAEKMVEMMLGLAKGTCRLQPPDGVNL